MINSKSIYSFFRFLLLIIRIGLQLIRWVLWIWLSEFFVVLTFNQQILRANRMEWRLRGLHTISDIDGCESLHARNCNPSLPVWIPQSIHRITTCSPLLFSNIVEYLSASIYFGNPASLNSYLFNHYPKSYPYLYPS